MYFKDPKERRNRSRKKYFDLFPRTLKKITQKNIIQNFYIVRKKIVRLSLHHEQVAGHDQAVYEGLST